MIGRTNMTAWHPARRRLWTLIFSAIATCALAQQPATQEFTPEVGQHGKDVVWVPSPQQLVEKMLDMAKVTSSDYVIDLGSGDGRTVIAAAKRGASALGIEYNADIFQSDLSKATVVTMFLLTELNLRLRPTLLALKPGTRIVSNTFRMGDWHPEETADLHCDSYCTAYLWIVPARVEGVWHLPRGEL